MKPRPPLPEGPFLVVGLARSGAAVAELLARRGQVVRGCDAGTPDQARRLAAAGVEVHLDADGVELLDAARTVVKSPGVPGDAPVIVAARGRGIEVVGEMELAWRALTNRFVAVTGTNGKTTVTELAAHIWRTAGEPVAVAGNVGTPLASLAGKVSEQSTVVCECSSFQLEDSDRFAPECAVFLNIAPDHLDRHPAPDSYLAAKLRIFANQGNDDVAVYNGDEPALAGRDLGGCARRIAFCSESAGPDCAVELRDGVIHRDGEAIAEAGELPLAGAHNIANAMAAAAAALAVGIPAETVRDGLRSFSPLPHRLERVGESGGVLYVNDSKATNVAAAAAGIRSFEGGVHAILGGQPKGEGFIGLLSPLGERCVACYLIGEAEPRLAEDLQPLAGDLDIRRCGDLGRAVREAGAAAKPGQVVLLSPACASFDAYPDFEARGEHFRSLVEALA